MSTSTEGRPGRYHRSFGGLVTAMVVTVVVVGGLLWVLSLFRSDLEVEQQTVDHLEAVEGLQEADREREKAGDPLLRPVYPERLPEGWVATGAETPTLQPLSFEVRMLTDEEEFVAVHQSEGTSVLGLVHAKVDEDATEGDSYRTDAAVAGTWQTFTDAEGDTAYVTELGEQVLLVYGAAPADDLRTVIGLLTREPVRG